MKLLQTESFQIAVNEYGDAGSDNVCILLPGRLDTKDYANFVSHGELLAEMGYFVNAVDAPGTWDSPGSLDDYCTSTYIQAVNELIALLGNRPAVLLGHSRGGATAILASSNPHINALILINAAYGAPSTPNPNKMVGNFLRESRDLPPGDKVTSEQRIFMLPMHYFDDGIKYDPLKALRSFKGPKLIIQSDKDEFEGLDEVQKIYQGLSGNKSFAKINSTHDYRLYPQAINDANIAIREFLS